MNPLKPIQPTQIKKEWFITHNDLPKTYSTDKWIDALLSGIETLISQASDVVSQRTVPGFAGYYFESQLYLLKKSHQMFLVLRSHPESEGLTLSILKLEQYIQDRAAALRYGYMLYL